MLDGYTVDVVERQDTDENILFPRQVLAFCGNVLECVDCEVGVAEHDALGTTCCAGTRCEGELSSV